MRDKSLRSWATEDFWITRKACEESGGRFVPSNDLTLVQIAEAKAGEYGNGWFVDADGHGWVWLDADEPFRATIALPPCPRCDGKLYRQLTRQGKAIVACNECGFEDQA